MFCQRAPRLRRIATGYESEVYLVSGDVEIRWGEGFTQVTRFEPGTFCFVPAGVPHVVVNLSVDHAASAVVARNDPGEDETVEAVSYSPPLGA